MSPKIIHCRHCHSDAIVRYGYQSGHPRFLCKTCSRVFKTEYIYTACEPGIRERIVDMAVQGNGIRNTARTLGVAKNTVVSQLKKTSSYNKSTR